MKRNFANSIVLWEIHVPYEEIELMEMAMANNQVYFDRFRADIESGSFSIIVSPVLWDGYQDVSSDPYWYENNVWSEYVASTILTFYAPIYSNEQVGLAVYAPK